MAGIQIGALLGDSESGLELVCVAGAKGLVREIGIPDVQRLGLAIAGYTDHIDSQRVQIFGGSELAYFRGLAEADKSRVARQVCGLNISAVVFTGGRKPPAEIVAEAETQGVPLLITPLSSRTFTQRANSYLHERLTATITIHGVLVDVLGVGILVLGKSGIGKSEAALDLVLRGHRLVADDVVEVRRFPGDLVYGRGADIIKHHMEIRGLGIINIKDLFGIASVRDRKRIELVVELVEWNAEEEYDRLGVETSSYRMLGVELPLLVVPVRPGRNMASLIEVAARNQLLKYQGYHSARAFQERLDREIARRTALVAAPVAAASGEAEPPPPRLGEDRVEERPTEEPSFGPEVE